MQLHVEYSRITNQILFFIGAPCICGLLVLSNFAKMLVLVNYLALISVAILTLIKVLFNGKISRPFTISNHDALSHLK